MLLSSLLLVNACGDQPQPAAQPSPTADVTHAPTAEPTPEQPPAQSDVDETDTNWAQSFVDFALGHGPAPTVSRHVRFFLGGEPAGVMSRGEADRRNAWSPCPPGKRYAAGICPFDILQPLRWAAAREIPLIYAQAPRPDACTIDSERADLTSTHDLHRIVIGPPGANCATDFRIELYYDGSELAAVNLSLSEP